jgi:hypothetical protein
MEIESRRIKWEGHLASLGRKRNADGVVRGKLWGRKTVVRYKRIWAYNIKMKFTDMVLVGLDRTRLVQDRTHGRLL